MKNPALKKKKNAVISVLFRSAPKSLNDWSGAPLVCVGALLLGAMPAAAQEVPAPTVAPPVTGGMPPVTAPPVTAAPEPPRPAINQQPISVQEAIQIAYQQHARVTVAEEGVEAARQRIRLARTGTLPLVTGEVAYSGRGTNSLFGAFGGEPTRTVRPSPGSPGQPRRVLVDTDTLSFNQGLQPRLGLAWNVYDGGQTRAQVRQARAGLDANQSNLAAVRNNLEFDVTANYLLQLRSERLLELRITQERLAEEQLARVEARISAGEAPAADRALALSDLRNRQVDRIQAQNDVQVSANALRNAMGLPVGPPLNLVELRERLEEPPTLEQLQEIARRQRPEVVQAAAQVQIAEQGVALARINRRPRLDTVFSFNVNPNNPLQRSDFAVGANVSVPVFDFGRTHAIEQEARTDVQATTAQLEQVRKDVQAEVVEAYLNLINARQRLEASRLAVEAAQVNLENATARYQLGAAGANVVELITAQTQFATANNNAISALYDVFLAQAQLDRAIGQ